MNISAFIREFAPDFCWMTQKDLLLMAEQVDEDVNERSFPVVINRLVKRGELIARPWPHPTGCGSGRPPLQYLRVKPPC